VKYTMFIETDAEEELGTVLTGTGGRENLMPVTVKGDQAPSAHDMAHAALLADRSYFARLGVNR
jgi:hypothetical protein